MTSPRDPMRNGPPIADYEGRMSYVEATLRSISAAQATQGKILDEIRATLPMVGRTEYRTIVPTLASAFIMFAALMALWVNPISDRLTEHMSENGGHRDLLIGSAERRRDIDWIKERIVELDEKLQKEDHTLQVQISGNNDALKQRIIDATRTIEREVADKVHSVEHKVRAEMFEKYGRPAP